MTRHAPRPSTSPPTSPSLAPQTAPEGPGSPSQAPEAPGEGSARDRILRRVSAASARRRASRTGDEAKEHPGLFAGGRPAPASKARLEPPITQFGILFQSVGGEMVEVPDEAAASEWLESRAFGSTVCLGADAPDLLPEAPRAEAHVADLAISRARAAVAETGSIVLDSRDGRRPQLLAPIHVVVVHRRDVHATLVEALTALQGDLPSAIGLHSGPSKSADIGQVMVRGVHGPGRIVAVVITG